MAKTVQIENGYTKIANELLEALAVTNLNGTQRRIIDVVFRQTYGYQRKDHKLSIQFIATATNIHKMQIQREITKLIECNIITVVSEASFNKSRVIAFNKSYKEWIDSKQLAKKLTLSESDNHTVSELANTTVSGLANQRKKKENYKEKRIDTLFEDLWSIYPNKKGKARISTKQKNKLWLEVGEEKLRRAILNYSDTVKDTDPKFIMHGSTFFNSGYVDYLQVEAKSNPIPKGKTIYLDDEGQEKLSKLKDDLQQRKIDIDVYKRRLEIISQEHEMR